jgi:hypothetical protein
MFAKDKVTQSMIDAVNQVLGEEKKRLINDAEMDETGFHKAAHAAKKAGQSHFEFQGKKYPATAKSHKEAIEVDEAAVIIPTSTGKKVYGSSYGNSAKAEREKTKSSIDTLKGPKTKELKSMEKEPKKNLDEAGDCVTEPQAKDIAKKEVGKHEKGMHGKSGEVAKHVKKMHKESYFTAKLLSIYEAKSSGTEEIFTDNNMGEEMTDKQKAKREKIVMSMKKGEAGMKQRYGKNWKNVMYATATKQAMKEDSSDEWEGEQLDEAPKEISQLKKKIAHYDDAKQKIRWGKSDPLNDPYGEGGSRADVKSKSKGTAATNRTLKSNIKRSLGIHTAPRLPEEVELEEVKKSDVPAFLRKMRGDKPLTMKDVKSGDKDSISHKDNLAKARNEEFELIEKNDSHTHAAHYENEKGEWTGMNLFTAKDDEDAVKQAQAKCKEGCRLSKVERHTTVKEAVETEPSKAGEAHKVTTDMLSGREKGGKLNSFKNFKVDLVTSGEETIAAEVDKGEDTREKQKIMTNPGPVDIKLDDKLTGPTPYTHFSSEYQITHEETQIDEKVIAGTPGWKKIKRSDEKGNVTDKSGAVHTPSSRAKDLARKAFKKLKKETMMGKISN